MDSPLNRGRARVTPSPTTNEKEPFFATKEGKESKKSGKLRIKVTKKKPAPVSTASVPAPVGLSTPVTPSAIDTSSSSSALVAHTAADEVDHAEKAYEKIVLKRKFLLQPESIYMQLWSMFIAVVLLFVAVWTPVEVAFLEPQIFSFLFWMNRSIDLIFIIDMVFQFFLPFKDDVTGKYVEDKAEIAALYLGGWFWIDLVSIIPFDMMTEIGLEASNFRIFRVVRLLRLIKILRVLRVVKTMSMFNLHKKSFIGNYVIISYTSRNLMKYLAFIVVLSHWVACIWHLIGGIEVEQNWIRAYGIEDESLGTRYATSFYWAVMTLTTIGYGDVSAQNVLEQGTASFIMLMGGGVYAYVVGGICSTLASMNPEKAAFHASVDQLNTLMADAQVPNELRLRMRYFFNHAKAMHAEKYKLEVIRLMSPGLQREFTSQVYAPLLKAISFLALESVDPGVAEKCISEVVLCLREHYFPQGEQIIRYGEMAKMMYIVRTGLVGCGGRVLRVDSVFGEDIICGSKREYLATTLTFTSVLALAKDDMLQITQQGGYETILASVMSQGRWMRVKQSLIVLARVRRFLLKNTAMKRHLDFVWENDAKLCLLVELNGETSGDHKISIEHLRLLLSADHQADLAKILQPLAGMLPSLKIMYRHVKMRRDVLVGQMDTNDISSIISEVVRAEIAKAVAPLQEEIKALRAAKA